MSSIIQGYNYDIFISYRQKDNRHDGWVTEFVNNLKGELESTFKEEISVYFDENPHDGLLETHDVDASLKEKLKCLIFIPIISRTYCDPKSFAWEHEFKAFVEMASQDQFGLKVKLPNGNVASRVLPVQIHELDDDDRKLFESCIGGFIRGIEFRYKESGVDRPLTGKDNEEKNRNKINYRNQINKAALAIKEILYSLKNQEKNSGQTKVETSHRPSLPINKKLKYYLTGTILILALTICGIFLGPKLRTSAERSIAVLPFVNMSNDRGQDYFCEGIMQEIVNNLFMIGGLDISPTTSSIRDKESDFSHIEKAKQLQVKYLLEGLVSKSENHVRITVRLINGKNGKMLWVQPYDFDVTATDLINLYSDVAQKVAKNMNIVLQTSLKERMSYLVTKNTEAYDLFLQSRTYNYGPTAKALLEKAIELDPSFSDAYAELAYYYIWSGGHHGTMTSEEVLARAEPLIKSALEINSNCSSAHEALVDLNLLYKWDFKTVEKELKTIQKLNPSDPYESSFTYFLVDGKFSEALKIGLNLQEKYKDYASYWIRMALAYSFNDQAKEADNSIKMAWKIESYSDFLNLNTIRIYNNNGWYSQALDIYDKYFRKDNEYFDNPYYWGHIGIAAFKTGDITRSDTCLRKLLVRCEGKPLSSPCFFTAALYTAMGESDKAIAMLEKALKNREVEMYWLKSEPIFRALHGDQRYENILKKIGFD